MDATPPPSEVASMHSLLPFALNLKTSGFVPTSSIAFSSSNFWIIYRRSSIRISGIHSGILLISFSPSEPRSFSITV